MGLLTVEEAAARLRVSEWTLRKWLREGRLRGSRPGRDWRIEEAAVAELLARGPERGGRA